MVHQGSTTILLCLVIFMATLLVTPGAAVIVKVFKSKDEAEAFCNNVQGDKNRRYSMYPGQGDKDIFYSCGDKTEMQSSFKAGAPCKQNQH